MHSAAHLHPHPPVPDSAEAGQNASGSAAAGLTLVEADNTPVQLVGISAAWRKLVMQAEMAAPHLQVATIEGEHGVGKHSLARYLYSHSPLGASVFQRRDAREWLATDADPASLAGFTYLDRVDLLGAPGQGLLLGVLRALQDRAPGRAVIVASSETSLRQMAGQGLLLPDLAFRLAAIRFAVPPLRARREDIPPLAQALLDRFCIRYQQRPVLLGPGTLARLLQHNWPGNVRELASVLEAALLEAENGVIRAADLAIPDGSKAGLSSHPGTQYATHPAGNHHDSSLLGAGHPGSGHLGAGRFGANSMNSNTLGLNPLAPNLDPHLAPQPEDLALDAVIRRHVQYVLDLNRGNKLRAARQLSISRSTLYRILGNESFLSQ